MLRITLPEREYFDNAKQEFFYIKKQTLDLEHSLVSISKWESKWKKPFFTKDPKTTEEYTDYIRCMTLNQNVDPTVYYGLTRDVIERVGKYIDDSMTATWFNDKIPGKSKGGRGQVVTSELIYYWMVAYGIPFECQKWHLNRLLTLIRICEIKNAPSKNMKKKDIYAQYSALNNARRKNLGTNG